MSLPRYKTILYATDLSDGMPPVFRHALSLAKAFEAKIIVLHVVAPLGATGRAVVETYMPDMVDHLRSEGMKKVLKNMRQRLHDFCADELGDDPKWSKLVSKILVVSGHPAEEICRHAEKYDVDLVLVGINTTSGFAHSLLGSTARKLMSMTKRPVLAVPPPKE